MKHLLIENAFEYDILNSSENMSNSTYDSSKGFWVNNQNGLARIDDPGFRPPRSKKADVETGEDKKGE